MNATQALDEVPVKARCCPALSCGSPRCDKLLRADALWRQARVTGDAVGQQFAALQYGAILSGANLSPAIHFVGFRGEEYRSAVRVFGLPDFFHRGWDRRAQREIAIGDVVVLARARDTFAEPSPYSFDDSNEVDDPAAVERLR